MTVGALRHHRPDDAALSLGLAAPTDPAWLARALQDIDEILVDHAHCEKKAASSVLALLFRYPERTDLAAPLARLAREELVHYETLVRLLRARSVPFGHRVPAPYAAELLAAVRRAEPERLLDTLLCMALIEARSCERMALLATAVPDGELAAFYRGLLASEARHRRVYVALARRVVSRDRVRDRLAELARHEAAILRRRPPAPRMHG